MSRLAKLLALANRPGTEQEGAAARAHAERLAGRDGLEVFESSCGELVAMDEFRADLIRRLNEIADEGHARLAREFDSIEMETDA